MTNKQIPIESSEQSADSIEFMSGTDPYVAFSLLQLIAHNLHDIFLVIDKELKIMLLSKSAIRYGRKMLGKEIKVGMQVLDLAPENQRKNILHLYASVFKGKSHYGELDIPVKSGEIHVIGCNYQPAKNNQGEIVAILISAVDITQEKKVESTIRQSEQQYRMLFSNNPLPAWIYDKETLQFLEVNMAAVNKYGYTKKEFMSLTLKDIRPPEDIPVLMTELNDINRYGSNFNNQWRHIKKNGELIHVEIKAEDILYNGRKGRLVMVNDITSRVESETELIKSNERFLLASKATSDAIWDWNIEKDKLKWGEGLYSLFGHYGNEIDRKTFYKLIHPDDRQKIKRNLVASFAKPEVSNWRAEYRLKNSRNIYRDVMDQAFIVRNEKNEAVRMIGAIKDITDLKEKEKALMLLNERYNIVSKATHDLIWDWNLVTGEVYRDEEGLETVYGIKKNEDIGHIENWLEHIHPDDVENVKSTIKEIQKNRHRDTFEIEYRFRRDNNSFSHVYDRGYIMRDHEGNAYRMIGAAQDISERKQLESKLLNQELNRQKIISQATIDTQEKERSEISKELHDNVNQVLTTTKLYLDLATTNNELKDELIRKSSNNIIYVINEIRQLSRSLMLPSLGDLGLTDSLKDLIENINYTHRLEVTFIYSAFDEGILEDNQKLMILRITQEALNNILKHAHASLATVHLLQEKNKVRLVIRDDGKGFNPKEVKAGAGLNNIRNRVYLFNGNLYIHSSEGKGCEIIIDIPV